MEILQRIILQYKFQIILIHLNKNTTDDNIVEVKKINISIILIMLKDNRKIVHQIKFVKIFMI